MTPRQALAEAIFRHTRQRIDFNVEQLAGLTDPLIIQNALDRLGISAANRDGLVDKILASYLDIFADRYPVAKDQTLFPGVTDLLDYLKLQAFRLGLITGNVERGAMIKLKPFGLWDYFSMGVFSSDAPNRDQLPVIALEKVKRQFAETYLPENVIIIGDTVRDVLCAHRNGMRSIAVLRYTERRKSIEVEKPDLIISGFEDLSPIMKYLSQFD